MIERVVIKAGGSLLELKGSVSKVKEFIDRDFHQKQVNLIVGGGAVVDAMRKLDAIHHFDSETMHWWCVDLLHQTYEIAGKLFPSAIGIDHVDEFQRHGDEKKAGLFLFSARAFYDPTDKDDLPCDWTTTSDSIAALMARKLRIERLFVIKTCCIPIDCDAQKAAELGIVDSSFPKASEGLDVQFLGVESLLANR